MAESTPRDEPTPRDGSTPREETSSERRTDRRGLFLAAGATGLGALAFGLADSSPAGAADGGPLLLGQGNTAADGTSLTGGGFSSENMVNLSAGVTGGDVSEKNGYGVYGLSENGICVYGTPYGDVSGLLTSSVGAVVGDSATSPGVIGLSSSNDGVHGETSHMGNSGTSGIDSSTGGGHGIYGRSTNGIGVYGTLASGPSGLLGTGVAATVGDSSASAGVVGLSSGNDGVHGVTTHSGSSGVAGVDNSSGGGHGTFGHSAGGVGAYGSSDTGVGVSATTVSGTALLVDGVASFSRSGSAVVAGTHTKPQTSVTVTGVGLSASSLILATPQGFVKGVAVAGIEPDTASGSFTIQLTKAVKVPLPIAWFIVG